MTQQKIPGTNLPLRPKTRTAQITLRLTPEEKEALQNAAQDYRGSIAALIIAMLRDKQEGQEGDEIFD